MHFYDRSNSNFLVNLTVTAATVSKVFKIDLSGLSHHEFHLPASSSRSSLWAEHRRGAAHPWRSNQRRLAVRPFWLRSRKASRVTSSVSKDAWSLPTPALCLDARARPSSFSTISWVFKLSSFLFLLPHFIGQKNNNYHLTWCTKTWRKADSDQTINGVTNFKLLLDSSLPLKGKSP